MQLKNRIVSLASGSLLAAIEFDHCVSVACGRRKEITTNWWGLSNLVSANTFEIAKVEFFSQ
jgi:hypothetical protein